MPLRVGDTEASAVNVGDTEASAVYVGDTEAYSAGNEQTFTGVTLIVTGSGSAWVVRGTGAGGSLFGESLQIDDGLLAASGTVYLRTFSLTSEALTDNRFWTATTNSGSGSDDGPQMSDAWESAGMAITIARGNDSVTIPGPNNSDSEAQDMAEPYTWRLGSDKRSELITFLNGIGAGTYTDFSITLSDAS